MSEEIRKMKGLLGTILCFTAVLMSGGCATTGLQQSFGTWGEEEATVDVKVNVLLERAYVQSVAGPGSAIDEWVIVEPVSNNVVTIYVTVREKELSLIHI